MNNNIEVKSSNDYCNCNLLCLPCVGIFMGCEECLKYLFIYVCCCPCWVHDKIAVTDE